jgi:hypothetical protein
VVPSISTFLTINQHPVSERFSSRVPRMHDKSSAIITAIVVVHLRLAYSHVQYWTMDKTFKPEVMNRRGKKRTKN